MMIPSRTRTKPSHPESDCQDFDGERTRTISSPGLAWDLNSSHSALAKPKGTCGTRGAPLLSCSSESRSISSRLRGGELVKPRSCSWARRTTSSSAATRESGAADTKSASSRRWRIRVMGARLGFGCGVGCNPAAESAASYGVWWFLPFCFKHLSPSCGLSRRSNPGRSCMAQPGDDPLTGVPGMQRRGLCGGRRWLREGVRLCRIGWVRPRLG